MAVFDHIIGGTEEVEIELLLQLLLYVNES